MADSAATLEGIYRKLDEAMDWIVGDDFDLPDYERFEKALLEIRSALPQERAENVGGVAGRQGTDNGAMLEIAARGVIQAFDLNYGKEPFELTIKRLREALQLQQ